MPELPEVQAVADSLQPLVQYRVHSVDLYRKKLRFTVDPHLSKKLSSRLLTSINRHAKFILMSFDQGLVLKWHLGMSGRFTFQNVQDSKNLADLPREKHAHLRFCLQKSGQPDIVLDYIDPRRFGHVSWYDAQTDDSAPDPLDIPLAEFTQRLAATSRAIKPLLLDQRKLVSGLGNIYADESLHHARIHPLHPASGLSPEQARLLHQSIKHVLTKAIQCKGSTLSDTQYKNASGEEGSYQKYHRVYDRADQDCITCKSAKIVRQVIQQRSAHFCPACQVVQSRL